MKHRFLRPGFGNKAFIFALDAAIAVSVVAVILFVANYYATTADVNPISDLEMLKVGSDILAVMDNKGVLDSLDEDAIKTEMMGLLPVNYHMRLHINGTFSPNIMIETTNENPTKGFIGTGERIFVTQNLKFGKARFWIWLK